ncbi:DUF2235 domain-containing protein [Ruegeria meonggei]|uniref:T6SS Phospholipase effector Tle1-like catalytic domain-containing protein n=1 Tax=Ruegeria meonggei TaxID=1446476 RepID=A0A1X7ABX7_9RHOB|nr:DUF2235 domain-containing protein [Ruegeria meonggei]SLN75076.1 hypothetical protein RUM8411_04117 [Ruegeria meonggei]
MGLSRLSRKVLGWLGRPLRSEHSAESRHREPISHVIILDGTMSTLEPGLETHAGKTLQLCNEMGSKVSVFYESGVQWESWKSSLDVMMGRGINRQIRRAYGYLASRYKPGDRIYFIGYSRGAYGVRSLAGVIDMIGLLKAEHATVRNIKQAYRHYECNANGAAAAAFRSQFCHEGVAIEMVGVWDTVKALGLRLPLLWRWAEERHAFHNHQLGPATRHGYHAMALDETREVYDPVLWTCRPDFNGHVEQVWFRGTHGDVGGQLNGFEEARPLSNISLIWMLDKAEMHGLPLPEGWRDRFPTSTSARSVGTWRGWGKIFLLRKHRKIGRDRSERLHVSVSPDDLPGWVPLPGLPSHPAQ